MRGGGLLRIGFRKSFPYINPIIYIGMKLNKFWFVAAAAAFVGCAEADNVFDVNVGGQRSVTISVALPEEETRANGNSASSGKANVDWNVYDLRFQIEVYDMDGNRMAFDRIIDKTDDGANYTSDDITLTAGRDYKIYAWADFVLEDTLTDLHYDTSNFTEITYKEGLKVNDESRDAYCGSETILKTQTGVTLNLQRPMGKLRVVTTDADKLSFGQYPDNVVFSCSSLPSGYNLKAGTPLANAPATAAAPMVTYGNESADGAERTLLSAYLFGSETTTVQFALTSKDGNDEIYTMNVANDVPVKPNMLTTLKGSTLTNTANIECTITDTLTEDEYVQDSNGNWVKVAP